MTLDDSGHRRGLYPRRTRELIYEQWAFFCGQDFTELYRRLVSDPVLREAVALDEGVAPPSVRTMKHWSERELWKYQADRQMQEMWPGAIRHATLTLATAVQPAAQNVAELLTTDRVLTNSDRIKAENSWKVIHTVIGTNLSDHLRPAVDDAVDLTKLREMTPEQLSEAERRMLEG